MSCQLTVWWKDVRHVLNPCPPVRAEWTGVVCDEPGAVSAPVLRKHFGQPRYQGLTFGVRANGDP